MNRKNITLLLSFAICCSFFMPLFDWHSFEMSGMNYIFSTHIPFYKYFLLLIPLPAAVLFFGALNGEKYLFSESLMSSLPFVVALFVLLMRYVTREPYPANSFFAEIDFGFWMILGFSFLLISMEAKKRRVQYPDYVL